MNAIDHLRKASELIAAAGRGNRVLCSEAAGHFWSATFDEEHWPLTLRVASTSLKAKLLARGTIAKTIQSLDAEHLAQLADELARFCLDATDELTRFEIMIHTQPEEPRHEEANPMISGGSLYSAS